MILSATMMLRHLGYATLVSIYDLILSHLCPISLDGLANNIASATFEVINEGKIRTQDMGGEHYIRRPMICVNTKRYSIL